jgi:hypothetical protein
MISLGISILDVNHTFDFMPSCVFKWSFLVERMPAINIILTSSPPDTLQSVVGIRSLLMKSGFLVKIHELVEHRLMYISSCMGKVVLLEPPGRGYPDIDEQGLTVRCGHRGGGN